MKIALDLRRIQNPGIGRYMKRLTEAMLAQSPQNQYLLIMPPDALDLIPVQRDGVEKIAPPLPYYSIREQIELPRILRRHKVDLLHSPHFNLPLVRPCATVVTIHDVIYLACKHDLPSPMGRLYYRSMMSASAKLATRVITDSEYSRQDIVRLLGIDPGEIDVIYPGVDDNVQHAGDEKTLAAVLHRYGITGPYLFYAGIYKPRKNHSGLLQSFQHFLRRGVQAKLVIAGPMSEGEAELRRLAKELGIADNVVFTGFVSDSDLAALYSGASVYACPSLYEGFGFTVLEAMASGVPVVCSPETSLREVGGDAALYANARDPEEFGTALYRVFADHELRETLTQKGHANVLRFRWADAARQTLAVYDQALQTQRRKSPALALTGASEKFEPLE